MLSDEKKYKEAREVFKRGVKHCPQAVDLWLEYAELEVSVSSSFSTARSILETARLKIPKNPRLWLAAIRVEQRAAESTASSSATGGSQATAARVASQLQSKALQECPTAGLLWAHAIASDPRPVRKARSYDALKRCTDDPHVFAAVAKLFWIDRKVKKARNWFQRAITVDPNQGDIWASYYKFELEHGTAETAEHVLKKCVEAEPRQGDRWKACRRLTENHSLKPDALLKAVAASMREIFDGVPVTKE